jgi:hypothetical protein
MGARFARQSCVLVAVVLMGGYAAGCGHTSCCGAGWVSQRQMYTTVRPAAFDYPYVAARETRWSHPWPEPTPAEGVVPPGQLVYFGRSLEGSRPSTGQHLGWIEGVGLRFVDVDALEPAPGNP